MPVEPRSPAAQGGLSLCLTSTPSSWPISRRGRRWQHHTEADAYLWLSRTCVAYGRSLAHLPALPLS